MIGLLRKSYKLLFQDKMILVASRSNCAVAAIGPRIGLGGLLGKVMVSCYGL